MYLHNYIAGIYLNTQKPDTKCRKFEPTDIYSYLWKVMCTRNLPNTSILILMSHLRLFPCNDRLQFQKQTSYAWHIYTCTCVWLGVRYGYSEVPKSFLSLSLCLFSSFPLSFPPFYLPSYPSSFPPTIFPFLPFFSPSSPPLIFLFPSGGAGAIATLIHDGFMNPIDGKYRVVSSGRSMRKDKWCCAEYKQ